MDEKVTEYIDKQKPPQKEMLKKIRKLIRQLIPNAQEKMSYGVPAFGYKNKLIMYAAFKSHIGLYPEPEVIKHFKKELAGYKTSKGTIQFDLDNHIPYDLIKKIVEYKF